MLTNCLQLDVCPSQKCTRSFKFPIQMSNKKTIFSRQKSLEDTIQSYCWPIKDIFTVLRALSRYVYLSKDIWERWFFSSADKTFESRRRGDHERPEWHLTNDNSDQQHSHDKSLISPRSAHCIQCPESSLWPLLQILNLPRTNNLSTLVDPNWIISKAKLKLCHAATNNFANYALQFLWYCSFC